MKEKGTYCFSVVYFKLHYVFIWLLWAAEQMESRKLTFYPQCVISSLCDEQLVNVRERHDDMIIIQLECLYPSTHKFKSNTPFPVSSTLHLTNF